MGLDVSEAETDALAAVNSKDVMFTDTDPPADVRCEFDTWDDVYERQHDIYRAQVRETDFLLEDLQNQCPEELRDSLVVVTGDHGHLFYDEGLVGHHSWLHPKLIQVPLFISFPDDWGEVASDIDDPVSLVDVARAVQQTTSGAIQSATEFVAELTSQDEVIVVADGSNWQVEQLYEEYPDDAVDSVAAKRVGIISDATMTQYERVWNEDTITKSEYELSATGRTLRSETAVERVPDDLIDSWLRSDDDRSEVTTSQRLKDLGYLE